MELVRACILYGKFGFSRPDLDGNNKLAKGMCCVYLAVTRVVNFSLFFFFFFLI